MDPKVVQRAGQRKSVARHIATPSQHAAGGMVTCRQVQWRGGCTYSAKPGWGMKDGGGALLGIKEDVLPDREAELVQRAGQRESVARHIVAEPVLL